MIIDIRYKSIASNSEVTFAMFKYIEEAVEWMAENAQEYGAQPDRARDIAEIALEYRAEEYENVSQMADDLAEIYNEIVKDQRIVLRQLWDMADHNKDLAINAYINSLGRARVAA